MQNQSAAFHKLIQLTKCYTNCYLLLDQCCKKFLARLFQNNAFTCKVYSIVGLKIIKSL